MMEELLVPLNDETILKKIEVFYKNLAKISKKNVLDVNIEKLIDLDQATPYNSSFFYAINTKKFSFDYIGTCKNQGIELEKYLIKENGLYLFWKSIHPNDLENLLIVWKKLTDYLIFKNSSMEDNQITYTWNYRLKTTDEKYINIVENVTPVWCNTIENSICMLSSCTIINSELNMKVSATANILKDNIYEKISFCNNSQLDLSPKISRREKDIINLLSLHRSSKEIGAKLCISTNTVNTHRRNIIKKLKLTSTGELIGLLRNKEYLEELNFS